MGNLGDLPEEVLVKEIMSRLPLELPKLKLVNKSWYSLIKDSLHKFHGKQLCLAFEGVHDVEDDPELEQGDEFSLKIFDSENNNNTNDVADLLGDNFMPFRSKRTSRDQKILLAGNHCDGIVCLVVLSTGNILLLNPLTKQGKFLPRKKTRLRRSDEILRVGFGYDEIARVYKVVKICGSAGFARGFSAHVYTLGDDDDDGENKKPVWRDIALQIDTTEYYTPTKKELYCRGSYYWLVTRKDNLGNELGKALHSFDIHAEEFRVVPLPNEFLYLISHQSYLTEWNGSVALLCYPAPQRPLEMWVMTDNHGDDDDVRMWTKHQSIAIDIDIAVNPSLFTPAIPIGFLDAHRLLLRLGSGGRHVVSYDLLTREVSHIYEARSEYFRLFHFMGTHQPLINM